MNWIIGDVHGEVVMLEKIISMVKEKDQDCILHFAGDYVDRGLQSKQVIDMLMGFENAYFIRGNHDDIFDMVINGESITSKNEPNEAARETIWFIQYGMVETLESYGVPKSLVLTDLIEAYERDIDHMLQSDKMYPDSDEDGEIANIMEKIRSYIPDSSKF